MSSTIALVDDHPVFREGLRHLLSGEPGLEVVGEAGDARGACAIANSAKPSVIVIDVALPDGDGIAATQEILRHSPRTRVLLISGAGRMSQHVARAAGASGFVSKDWDADDVAKAVRMVGMGMTVFRPQREQAVAAPAQLSVREREVLDLIATGATNREIAERLYLSPHTVKEHTSAVYRKLSVRNRAEAVRQAQELGLIG